MRWDIRIWNIFGEEIDVRRGDDFWNVEAACGSLQSERRL